MTVHDCPYENDIKQVKDDTQKIITGMYGPLDNPAKGFVHEVKADIKQIKGDVGGLKSVNQKIVWLILAAIIGALLKMVFGV